MSRLPGLDDFHFEIGKHFPFLFLENSAHPISIFVSPSLAKLIVKDVLSRRELSDNAIGDNDAFELA